MVWLDKGGLWTAVLYRNTLLCRTVRDRDLGSATNDNITDITAIVIHVAAVTCYLLNFFVFLERIRRMCTHREINFIYSTENVILII